MITGEAYYGEYPLAFAVYVANKDIYDYLIDNGAEPDFQDTFGNTVLHMAVIHNRPVRYSFNNAVRTLWNRNKINSR